MKKVLHWLDENLEEFLLVVFLIAMTLIMGIQVLSRYVLGQSLSCWCSQLLFADRRHGDGHDSGDSDPHTDPASDHRSNRHGPDPVRCQFLTGSRRSKRAALKSFRSLKRRATRYGPQRSRSIRRSRTRSMRIFMRHTQRIWQVQSKQISLLTGGIPLIHPSSFFLHCYPQKPPEYHHFTHIRS